MANWFFRLIGTSNQGEVDSQGQQRVIPYDSVGNSLAPLDRGAVSETAGGWLQSCVDYKLARTLRASSTGALQIAGDETIMLYDAFEGTTRNLNVWIETVATMTSAQALATGLTLNSGASVTTAQGCLETSHRQFPLIARTGLVFRARLRYQGATNCFEEFGFGAPTDSTTAVISNGAFFRRDGAGSLQPILAFNGTEGAGPTLTGPATTDYAWYEIFLEDDRALFQIISVTGVLISSAILERGATGGSGTGVAAQARLFAVTHLPAFFRTYNSGTAGTAPQIVVTQCCVMLADAISQRDYDVAQAGQLYGPPMTSPTAYTQLPNYANSAAPASATLSNTAAGYTTLGGQWQFANVAGAETDYALFGFTNPTPYTLYVKGINISAWNMGATNGPTTTTLQWGYAANSSAVSLATAAPYTPMRGTIGGQSILAGTPIGDMFLPPDVTKLFQTPLTVQPGRFFHIIVKVVVGAATGSQIIRGICDIDGYFE